MSVASELDVNMQDLVRVFTHGDGHDLLTAEPGSDAWADGVQDVVAELLVQGWLPPVHADVVRGKVKRAWETDDDAESFRVLAAAAAILGVRLVDPSAETVQTAPGPARPAGVRKVA